MTNDYSGMTGSLTAVVPFAYFTDRSKSRTRNFQKGRRSQTINFLTISDNLRVHASVAVTYSNAVGFSPQLLYSLYNNHCSSFSNPFSIH